ncbi:MAG: hypothetical protein ABJH98_18080 [Reichenbachiella sp.]|uniref:hypothetical protein n=1 Tax=Reichenbachiella sp. TaxID=2184521 RepID=UPI0032985178
MKITRIVVWLMASIVKGFFFVSGAIVLWAILAAYDMTEAVNIPAGKLEMKDLLPFIKVIWMSSLIFGFIALAYDIVYKNRIDIKDRRIIVNI